MAKMNALHDVMLDSLRDLFSAEKQLVQALPKMAKGADTPELQTAFSEHLEVTKGHVNRLEQVFAELDVAARAKHCKGMEGLIAEGKELLEADVEGAVKDAGLIGAAQKVEHYEIAAYGTLIAMATEMGHMKVADLLRQSLEEEKEADSALTDLAESSINPQANSGPGGMHEEAEDEESDDAAQDNDNRSRSQLTSGGESDMEEDSAEVAVKPAPRSNRPPKAKR